MKKLSQFLKGLECEILREGASRADFICIDNRLAKPGCIFVAIKGANSDGHDYVSSLPDGVSVVVVERALPVYPKGATVILTSDSREALALISANFYGHPAADGRLIGVTGTNGKTSTCFFLESILRQTRRKVGLIGTVGIRIDGNLYENAYGGPSTTPDPQELHKILRHMRNIGCEDIIMEVTSHALALRKLAGMHFDVGIFTNLSQDHLDFHGSFDNYLKAKLMLFKQSALSVINADDPASEDILPVASPALLFGCKDKGICAYDIKSDEKGTYFNVNFNQPRQFFMKAKGAFNVYNALAAIVAARALGVKTENIIEGINAFEGAPGRMQFIKNNLNANIIIDYAHTPDGLKNAVKSVKEFTKGRVITIFGCGGDRDRGKRPKMAEAAAKFSDSLIITSDNPRTEDPEFIIKEIITGVPENFDFNKITDRREAIIFGVNALKPGDSLIIAGKGHEDYQIIGETKIRFDDAEIAAEAISKRA